MQKHNTYLFIFLGSLVLFFVLFFSCKKEPKEEVKQEVVYQYIAKTYIGQSVAHFKDSVNGIVTVFDTSYVDSILVRTDSAQDHVVFTCNTNNPLQVYPQTDYPFALSSPNYRKDFIKNYYQSFYFEGDSLKSYFFKLNEGSTAMYSKEIKFSGTLKPE